MLAANEGVLASELFGLREGGGGEWVFRVHPVSGYLFYADYARLGKDSGDGLPRSVDEAEASARRFLVDANRRVLANPVLRRAGVPSLFPDDLRPAAIGGVVPLGASAPTHWLCRFWAYLPADRTRTARVEGSAVDVRIGGRGAVIGLSSRWRPIAGDLLVDELTPPGDHDTLETPSAGAIAPPSVPAVAKQAPPEGEGVTQLVYRLADERDPQTILAPFYLTMQGHEGDWEPASSHSLMVEILERAVGTSVQLAAAVGGGSGNYAYQWGYWTLDSFFEEGVQLLGTEPYLSLEPGMVNVVVAITDTLTHASAFAEKTVLPGGDDDDDTAQG